MTSAVIRRFWLLALILALSGAASPCAAAGAEAMRRVALVVGNGDYRSADPLKNAVGDAASVAARLKELGFEVVLRTDLGRRPFRDAIAAFAVRASTADAALFYYSGHGYALDGRIHLVPVDARLASRAAADTDTLPLADILAALAARGRPTLVFIDSCLDNPLPNPAASGDSGGIGGSSPPDNTFVAFAAEPGEVAYDGAAGHSPFASAFLDNAGMPGLTLTEMMRRVRATVEKATHGLQTPWLRSSLARPFSLDPSSAAAPADGG